MNDIVRDKLSRKDGSIPFWAEMVAGGMVSVSFSAAKFSIQ